MAGLDLGSGMGLSPGPGQPTAIPPKPGDTWRINLYSFRDGQRAALAWSPILGQGNFHRTSRFGKVIFAGAISGP